MLTDSDIANKLFCVQPLPPPKGIKAYIEFRYSSQGQMDRCIDDVEELISEILMEFHETRSIQ